MRIVLFTFLLSALIFDVTESKGQNLTIFKSKLPVEETSDKIEAVVKSLGLVLFEKVAHDKIVKTMGVDIPPTQSLLFEDPGLTAKILVCQQTTALDLPMEILVWEENEDVYIGFVDPKFMKKRFLIMSCDETLEDMSRLMIRIVNDALRE